MTKCKYGENILTQQSFYRRIRTMVNRFSPTACKSLKKAQILAETAGTPYVTSEHILLGILSESNCYAARILYKYGIDSYIGKYQPVKSGRRQRTANPCGKKASFLTDDSKKIIEGAYTEAVKCVSDRITNEHLLYSILCFPECAAAKIIICRGVVLSEMKKELLFSSEHELKPIERIVPNQAKIQVSYLEKYGVNMVNKAKRGCYTPLIGRKDKCDEIIRVLCRCSKNNPCLVGDPGVGKTAVVEGIAQKISSGVLPPALSGKLIYSLDLSSMISGAKYRGEFEERMKGVISEAISHPEIILFIDEIHTVIGAGAAEGAIDAADMLKPALGRGELRIIGATTYAEYKKIEKDSALERRFTAVKINEPTTDEAIAILRGLREKFEKHHGILISDSAIKAAVELSERYIPEKHLPDKAIDLLDEAASWLALDIEKQAVTCKIDTADENSHTRSDKPIFLKRTNIEKVVSLRKSVPVNKPKDNEITLLRSLSETLSSEITGQDRAVKAVSLALCRARLRLENPDRPLAVFLFTGPTGVGKTALAKIIAKTLYNDKEAFIRLDMSEYSEKHSVSKLIGSPPGYVGYDDGGQLTERVRRHPYCVVLFDEIEKADSCIYNMLLQIFDNGSLHDSSGRNIDFRNTIIIMTSNCGADELSAKIPSPGFCPLPIDTDVSENAARDRLKKHFSPEFLARIDETVIFHPLSDGDLRKIAAATVNKCISSLSKSGYCFIVDENVIDHVAFESKKEGYGARMIQKNVKKMIENPIAELILSGEIKQGDRFGLVLEQNEKNIAVMCKKIAKVDLKTY